jgi:hypothetical protein
VVGSTGDGIGEEVIVPVASGAEIVSVETGDDVRASAGFDAGVFSIGAGGAVLVAQPRSSMRIRIAARTNVTMVLN